LLVVAGVAVSLISCSLVSSFRPPWIGGDVDHEGSEDVEEGASEAPDVSGEGDEGATGLQSQIDNGDLVWGGAVASGEGPTGPVIAVTISNPGDDDIETIIPCGSLLIPADSGDQVMMVVQAEDVTVPAGEEIMVTPYVVCIDAGAAIPGDGSAYALGGLTEGNLLRLAQCVCEDDLEEAWDPLGGMSVQFAAWMTAEGSSLTEALEQGGEGGAMGEFLGGEFGELVADMLGTLEQPALEVLDRCDIELEP
jgi:hypothetical protein